jgi:hypothetical protein
MWLIKTWRRFTRYYMPGVYIYQLELDEAHDREEVATKDRGYHELISTEDPRNTEETDKSFATETIFNYQQILKGRILAQMGANTASQYANTEKIRNPLFSYSCLIDSPKTLFDKGGKLKKPAI